VSANSYFISDNNNGKSLCRMENNFLHEKDLARKRRATKWERVN
jgi:hypothetical protein